MGRLVAHLAIFFALLSNVHAKRMVEFAEHIVAAGADEKLLKARAANASLIKANVNDSEVQTEGSEAFIREWVASIQREVEEERQAAMNSANHNGTLVVAHDSLRRLHLEIREGWGLLGAAFGGLSNMADSFGLDLGNLNACDFASGVVDVVSGVADVVGDVAGMAKDALVAAAKAAMWAAKKAWEQLMKVKKMFSGLFTMIEKGFTLIWNIVKFVGSLIAQVGKILVLMVKEGVWTVMSKPGWDSLKGMVKKTSLTANKGEGGGFLALDDIFQDLKDFAYNFLSKIGTMLGNVWDFVTGLVDKLKNSGPVKFLINTFSQLGGVIGDLISKFSTMIGLGGGISKMKGEISGSASGLRRLADYFLHAIAEVKHKLKNPITAKDGAHPLMAIGTFLFGNIADLAMWFAGKWHMGGMKANFRSFHSVWNKMRGVIDGSYGGAMSHNSLMELYKSLYSNLTNSTPGQETEEDFLHEFKVDGFHPYEGLTYDEADEKSGCPTKNKSDRDQCESITNCAWDPGWDECYLNSPPPKGGWKRPGPKPAPSPAGPAPAPTGHHHKAPEEPDPDDDGIEEPPPPTTQHREWTVKGVSDKMQYKFKSVHNIMNSKGGIMRSVMDGMDGKITDKRSGLVAVLKNYGPQLKAVGINVAEFMGEAGLDSKSFQADLGSDLFEAVSDLASTAFNSLKKKDMNPFC